MYRVTFTTFIAVTLLVVYIHSIEDTEFGPGEGSVGGDNNVQNRFSASSGVRSNSQVQMNTHMLFKPKPFGINRGGAGGAGSSQTQQGDNSRARNSGGNGGSGGTIRGSGGQNFGGVGGSGSVQAQQGVNSVSDVSGGNGGSGGSVEKRDFSMASSFSNGPSFRGGRIGGRGGDGNVQVQQGENGFSGVSGGNGGSGGGFRKRDFSMASSFRNGPSFRGGSIGGRGGDGNAQVQQGANGVSNVSGGNGGAGGNVGGGFEPSFGSSQMVNMESNISAEKRGLGSNKNASRVLPADHVGQ